MKIVILALVIVAQVVLADTPTWSQLSKCYSAFDDTPIKAGKPGIPATAEKPAVPDDPGLYGLMKSDVHYDLIHDSKNSGDNFLFFNESGGLLLSPKAKNENVKTGFGSVKIRSYALDICVPGDNKQLLMNWNINPLQTDTATKLPQTPDINFNPDVCVASKQKDHKSLNVQEGLALLQEHMNAYATKSATPRDYLQRCGLWSVQIEDPRLGFTEVAGAASVPNRNLAVLSELKDSVAKAKANLIECAPFDELKAAVTKMTKAIAHYEDCLANFDPPVSKPAMDPASGKSGSP